MHPVIGCHHHGRDQIVTGIRPDFTQRDLRPGQDDRFAVVPEGEGERRGRVGHGVGSMKDNKTVVRFIMFCNHGSNGIPLMDCDIGGIEQRIHVNHIPCRHLLRFQFGDGIQKLMEFFLFRCIPFARPDHANGSARIDDENLLPVCLHSLLRLSVHSRFPSRRKKKRSAFLRQ